MEKKKELCHKGNQLKRFIKMEKAGELHPCDRDSLLSGSRKVIIEKSEQGTAIAMASKRPRTLQEAYEWHQDDCPQCQEASLKRPKIGLRHFINRLVNKQKDANHLGVNKKGGMENL